MSEGEKKESETPLLDGVEELSLDLVRLTFKAAKLVVREVKEVLRV